MPEKLAPLDPKERIKSAAYLKKWMTYTPDKMADPDNLTIFYGNATLLINDIEKSSDQKLTALKIQFHQTLGKYKEVSRILYPDLDPTIQESDDEPYYSEHHRMSMRNEPMLCEVEIFKLMQEFTQLAQVLLGVIELLDITESIEQENAEFQDMAVGSAIAPVIEGAKRALDGALAIIPGRKKSTDPSQDN